MLVKLGAASERNSGSRSRRISPHFFISNSVSIFKHIAMSLGSSLCALLLAVPGFVLILLLFFPIFSSSLCAVGYQRVGQESRLWSSKGMEHNRGGKGKIYLNAWLGGSISLELLFLLSLLNNEIDWFIRFFSCFSSSFVCLLEDFRCVSNLFAPTTTHKDNVPK